MPGSSDETRERILTATYACIARDGLSRTTVEDAAQEALVSRATVYRLFPGGRDELIRATVDRQVDLFFLELRDAVAGTPDFPTMLGEGLLFARQALLRHEVLQEVLAREPQRLLAQLSVSSDRVLPLIAAFLVPYLERERLRPGVSVTAAADYLARMILSFIGSSGSWDLTDPVEVDRLVRTELLGGVLEGEPDRPR
ncbi:MAG: TetR/AcrR family transcriptional regulator [Acidimicrobiales bacterium]|nr:TetR/AcrR family transcriptional regulator [Acidimicrobiales bacterium]